LLTAKSEWLTALKKIEARVETQPRFKIQYPMKNHGKDAFNSPNGAQ
jgi:hypothetical protein